MMHMVPWYPRPTIDKLRRAHQHTLFVCATVSSLNCLEKVTCKVPENTEIFLLIFNEAFISNIEIWPSSCLLDILKCLLVGESDLSLRHTRTLLCVITFAPKSWEV